MMFDAPLQAESYEAEQAETIEIPDAEELERVNADPLSRLERTTEHAQRAAAGRAELAALVAEGKERHKEDYKLNKALRAQLRSAKKEAAALDSRWVQRSGLDACVNIAQPF